MIESQEWIVFLAATVQWQALLEFNTLFSVPEVS